MSSGSVRSFSCRLWYNSAANPFNQLLQNTGFSVLEKTLDPYYLRAHRFTRLKADAYYYSCLAFMQIFRINVYDAMLVVARKVPIDSNHPLAGEP